MPPPERLGRFEIRSLLGAGGMGEVYRARDTRLGRDVALKILKAGLAADEQARQRFEQEARAIAALAHPNIVTVFDVGSDGDTTYLVTEILEGETLRDRLARGRLAVAEALDIATQIARGLEQAHQAGLVHRDVKPHNIFLTRSGVAKLLDFGIARLVEPPGGPEAATVGAGTGHGVVIGTPGYMAPEQARGERVDARTDVFAFGCVLYALLTGRAPFDRPTAADATAAVLTAPVLPMPPDPSRPALLDRAVMRCLEKRPGDRFQSMADLTFVLAAARDEIPAGSRPLAAPEPPRSRALLWAAAVVLPLAGAALGMLVAGESRGGIDTAIQAATVVTASARPITAAIAPDGAWVAYVGLAEGRPDLYVQFLNGGAPANLTRGSDMPVQNRTIVGGLDVLADGTGIAVAGRPVPEGLFRVPGIWMVPAPSGGPVRRVTDRYAAMRWSPDGRHVAGVVADPLAGDAVAVADVDGQSERILVAPAGGIHLHQLAWGHDGRHVYYQRSLDPRGWSADIYRVSVDGGAPEPVVVGEGLAMHPAPTPDGRALVYAADRSGEGANIWWRAFDGSPARRLTAGSGEYTDPFLAREGAELVCLARRRRGDLVRIAVDDAAPSPASLGDAGSGDGDPSVAVSSGRIFISSARTGRHKIWSLDASGQNPLLLTSGDSHDVRPAASPDGRWVAFISNREGARGVWVVPADGGTARRIVQAEVLDYVSWAPDSQRIAYAAAAEAGTEVWTAGLDGAPPARISQVIGRSPAWSPVGDVIAVVQAVDGRPALRFISSSGAEVRPPLVIDGVGLPTAVAWSPDGTRLAMVNLPGRGASQVWLARFGDGSLKLASEQPAPGEFGGVTWSADGRSLLVGRIEYETEVVLLKGLPGGR